MRLLVITAVLLTSYAVAQTKAPATQKPTTEQQAPAKSAPSAAKPAQPAAVVVPENAPVITINGLCEGKAVPAADCKTVITRAEFERIVGAVTEGRAGAPAQLPPAAKRNVATQYTQLLTVATDAEKEGVQNTPEAQLLMKFARMQALAQAYSRELQKKFAPTPAEIQAFYNANAAKLEEATVDRLVIPRTTTKDAKAPQDTEKTKADKLRARALAGESFETLQKEALQGTTTAAAPETKLVVQKASLPPNQASVFDLKPGEVSQVFAEPNAFFIYKMESKGTVPLDQVKDEIEKKLVQDKLQSAMETMLQNAKPVLNEQYFGPEPAGTELPSAPQAPKPSSVQPK
jgi:hypothetical protein